MLTKQWLYAAGIRAVKTFAQTILSVWVVGGRIEEFDWKYMLSVAAGAAAFSLVTSLKGLPEVGSDGTMKIDTSDPEKDVYSLELNSDLETLATKKSVTFTVTK